MNPNDLQLEDVFDKNDFVDEVEVLSNDKINLKKRHCQNSPTI
jgi:hypothetical protein